MRKFLSLILIAGLVFSNISFAKGFRIGGFKYYKGSSTLKHGNSPFIKKTTSDKPVSQKYDTTKLKQKFQNNKTQTSKTTALNRQSNRGFLSSPLFKWLIGSMIFGAILSLLMGHGFHFGAPGLLELLLILGIIYLIYKAIKISKGKERWQESS